MALSTFLSLGFPALPIELQQPFHLRAYAAVYGVEPLFVDGSMTESALILGRNVTKTWRPDFSVAQRVAFRNMVNALLTQRRSNIGAFQHPHIVPLTIKFMFDISNSGSELVPALVVPWYKHSNILNFCKQHPRTSRLRLILQIARALEHLHAYDVKHGNLYPGNILVTDDHNAVITDVSFFTEACRHIVFPHDAHISLQPSLVYQAPEVLNPGTNMFESPTKAADVYAFGSTIFAILTDQPPFPRRIRSVNLVTMMPEILQHGHRRVPQPPRDIISMDMWDLIQRCWLRNDAARPIMRDVVSALENIQGI